MSTPVHETLQNAPYDLHLKAEMLQVSGLEPDQIPGTGRVGAPRNGGWLALPRRATVKMSGALEDVENCIELH